ncbi:hypothetical protein Mycch_3726 [Mycolicibacterium chubuense NBB4]|uniref:Uncharacterized protein n=1 Tax=Mycolicibacterium chubuense (strain NBB4) TaxID=710421 RepID=I4BMF1_MYCCN|nr:hypothetical protein [Mycolicibacterium chubuense]AFM18458.1 hypothetical protein Mycch_3726 [Mycolicibacterium chubuense NBB4]
MAEVASRTPSSDDPFNEAVATTGLFLIMTAVIALAVALASWTLSEPLFAAMSGAVALLSFSASIFCFKAQALESAPTEVTV